MIVGVAGKLGSGKGAVVQILSDAGYQVIDVDQVGHRALVSERERIIEAFGPEVLGTDGQIDRRRLGSLVFASVERRRRLEEIVHPVMIRRVAKLAGVKSARTAIDAALLYPLGLNALCELVIWVRAPLLLRIFRTVVIDGKRLTTILQMMWAQRGQALKQKPSNVDTLNVSYRNVYNVATRGLLRRQIEVILAL